MSYDSKIVGVDVEMSSGKTDDFSGLQKLLDDKLKIQDEIAQQFAFRLAANADERLHSTKERYIDAIYERDGVVTLDTSDFIVGMMEDGASPFDMKERLNTSSKVKIGKDGKKYMSIPISKYSSSTGKYIWKNLQTGRFDKGSNPGGTVEFRVMSENSAPSSFIHPGHSGYHFIQQTLDQFDNVIDEYMDKKIDVMLNQI